MSSNRRIQASRANGAKSRGPVTPEGKRKSASNSVRHGLLSSLVVLDDEKPEIFTEIFNALTSEFAPQTEAERILVENMAVARWRQMRLWVIERASFQSEIEKHDAGTIHPATRAALAFRALADQSRALDLLNRYESRFDRQFARSLNLLMKLADPENPLHRLRQTNLVPNSDTPADPPDAPSAVGENPLATPLAPPVEPLAPAASSCIPENSAPPHRPCALRQQKRRLQHRRNHQLRAPLPRPAARSHGQTLAKPTRPPSQRPSPFEPGNPPPRRTIMVPGASSARFRDNYIWPPKEHSS